MATSKIRQNDASDAVSTASSFLDFIEQSNLSMMFNEDGEDSLSPEVHLDAIFQRINISVPKQQLKGSTGKIEWGHIKQMKSIRRRAKEKRRLYLITRNQARQERQQKRREKKKARAKEQTENNDIWSKMTNIGRKSKRKSGSINSSW